MIYREFRPSPALRQIVERLWWLEGPADAIVAEPIPPDGHTEIIVHAGDPFVEDVGDGSARVQDRVLLAGQATRAVRVMPRGFARVVGARLRPDGAHALLGAPQDAHANHIVDLRSVHRQLARRLHDDVAGRECGLEMVRALDGALQEAMPARLPLSPVRAAIAHARRCRGLARVPDLAYHAGISVRQLERVFGERIGLTPKMYLRIIRFQEVLGTLRDGKGSATWADMATSHGYYDQAHFIRDFRTFGGGSPGAWIAGHDSLTAMFSAIRRAPDGVDVAFVQDPSSPGPVESRPEET